MSTAAANKSANRKKARLAGALWLVLLLLVLILPMLTYQTPPPGQEGILVNLGLPDQGQGDQNAPPAEVSDPLEEQTEPLEEPVPEEEQETIKEDPQAEPEPESQEEVITSEDPEQVRLEQEKQRREQAEREAERKREEARKKAEAEARKKQEAEKMKENIGDLFGGGDGKGKTDKPGNQGDPEGDPNAKKLEGITTGSGVVGGGLGDRGVGYAPKITDDSQKKGTVVVRVCVDKTGQVTSAEFTQKGSSVSDNHLVQLAERNARQWRFDKSNIDKQCGTITYRFTLQ